MNNENESTMDYVLSISNMYTSIASGELIKYCFDLFNNNKYF